MKRVSRYSFSSGLINLLDISTNTLKTKTLCLGKVSQSRCSSGWGRTRSNDWTTRSLRQVKKSKLRPRGLNHLPSGKQLLATNVFPAILGGVCKSKHKAEVLCVYFLVKRFKHQKHVQPAVSFILFAKQTLASEQSMPSEQLISQTTIANVLHEGLLSAHASC